MSIIYSYPEQGTLNSGDMLIGTSVEKVGGKQKNVTKNFSIQQIADFINRGAGLIVLQLIFKYLCLIKVV